MSKKIRMILMLTFLIQTTTFSVDFIQKKVDSNISLTNNTIPQMVNGKPQNIKKFNKIVSELQDRVISYNNQKDVKEKLTFKYFLLNGKKIQTFYFNIFAKRENLGKHIRNIKVGTFIIKLDSITGQIQNLDFEFEPIEDSLKASDYAEGVGEIISGIPADIAHETVETFKEDGDELVKEFIIEFFKALKDFKP